MQETAAPGDANPAKAPWRCFAIIRHLPASVPGTYPVKMNALFLVFVVAVSVSCSKQAPIDASETATPLPSIPLTVMNWGPQGTSVGVPVNAFPDGQSGLYFTLSRSVAGYRTEVLFEGESLGGVAVNDKVVTAMLPASYLSTEGKKRIVIKVEPNEMVEVGDFVVTAPGAASDDDSQGSEEGAAESSADAEQPAPADASAETADGSMD